LMLGDNKQACRWSRTEMVTYGNRFIERQYHKVREFILAGDLETRYINTTVLLFGSQTSAPGVLQFLSLCPRALGNAPARRPRPARIVEAIVQL